MWFPVILTCNIRLYERVREKYKKTEIRLEKAYTPEALVLRKIR